MNSRNKTTPRKLSFSVPEWPGENHGVRDSVNRVLNDGTWGKYDGWATQELEKKLSDLSGQKSVSLCSSGTLGVEFALRGAGIRSGDEVILAGYDYPGNFRCIEACGAKPVLVDLLPRRWVTDVEHIARGYSERTRAVIVSHLHGDIADVETIRHWCDAQDIVLIEDACQVPGGRIFSRSLNGPAADTPTERPSGAWGHISVFSFGGSKLLTAGRGGAVATSDPQFQQRLRIWKDRGNEIAAMSELQAAALLPQLETLAALNTTRHLNAQFLQHLLAPWNAHLGTLAINEQAQPIYYKFPLRMTAELSKACERGRLLEVFQEHGLPIFSGFNIFKRRSGERCRIAEPLLESTLAAERTLLIHHPLLLCSQPQIEEVFQIMTALIESNIQAPPV